jgi:hypothetical protein
MSSYDFGVKLTAIPAPVKFRQDSLTPPSEITSQTYHLPPLATRKWIGYGKQLPPFKSKTLTSPYYFTNAKHHTKQCAQFRRTGNSCARPLLRTHLQPANCLTAGSLASSAQNHISCSETFVTSRHFKLPPPRPFVTGRHESLKPLPALGAWRHLWMTPYSEVKQKFQMIHDHA